MPENSLPLNPLSLCPSWNYLYFHTFCICFQEGFPPVHWDHSFPPASPLPCSWFLHLTWQVTLPKNLLFLLNLVFKLTKISVSSFCLFVCWNSHNFLWTWGGVRKSWFSPRADLAMCRHLYNQEDLVKTEGVCILCFYDTKIIVRVALFSSSIKDCNSIYECHFLTA